VRRVLRPSPPSPLSPRYSVTLLRLAALVQKKTCACIPTSRLRVSLKRGDRGDPDVPVPAEREAEEEGPSEDGRLRRGHPTLGFSQRH
jgi:hypothetical protein